MKSWTCSETDHARSKTKLRGQILEKTCVRFRDHIFNLILIKLGEKVFLDDTSDVLENGSFWVKKGHWFKS